MITQSVRPFIRRRTSAETVAKPSQRVPAPRSISFTHAGFVGLASLATWALPVFPASAQVPTKVHDADNLQVYSPDIVGHPGGIGLLQRLSSWGVPINEGGFFEDAVVDLGDGMTALIDADQFVEIIDAGGDVLISGFAVFGQITNDGVSGWLVDLDGNTVDFSISPRHGMGSTSGFLVQSEEAMGLLTVWFDYFAAGIQVQDTIQAGIPSLIPDVIPDIIPDIRPPRRGRRYCVCAYQLPDLTHTYVVKCSVMDCDLGNSCIHTEPGENGATYRGRCGWHEAPADAGFLFPAVAGMTCGLAAFGIAYRRRRLAN